MQARARQDKKLAELRDQDFQEYSRKIDVDIQNLKAAWDRAQSLFAQLLRGVSSRTSMDPTTEIHHQATRVLESAMNAWSARPWRTWRSTSATTSSPSAAG
jgi:hypothetical protein